MSFIDLTVLLSLFLDLLFNLFFNYLYFTVNIASWTYFVINYYLCVSFIFHPNSIKFYSLLLILQVQNFSEHIILSILSLQTLKSFIPSHNSLKRKVSLKTTKPDLLDLRQPSRLCLIQRPSKIAWFSKQVNFAWFNDQAKFAWFSHYFWIF